MECKFFVLFFVSLALVQSQRTTTFTKAEGCSQITLDECDDRMPFETYKNIEADVCQNIFCNQVFAGRCNYFIYDREHMRCQLYERPIEDYAPTCEILGAPRGIDFEACKTTTNPCDVSFLLHWNKNMNLMLLFCILAFYRGQLPIRRIGRERRHP